MRERPIFRRQKTANRRRTARKLGQFLGLIMDLRRFRHEVLINISKWRQRVKKLFCNLDHLRYYIGPLSSIKVMSYTIVGIIIYIGTLQFDVGSEPQVLISKKVNV